ncbi:MAG TPA: 7TM diverse intracellular signaling domain-containing protein [Oligoflexus sp.]|uniref:7TM diverse intracellular signaling domain-containing protein n=1 Tax=Oligoflexus sp. TaxID=1971216 RepID=UPI002D81038B|nr:7TM diverse intracellular signaling domain-containing protein [Oligoflexus sp.]HET9238299.1 7TM diverse intracellular signaling domain-containing protein [Oligoflexus sp.]
MTLLKVLALIPFFFSLTLLAAPQDIPTFTWEGQGAHAAGVYVRGDVYWQNVPCSEAEHTDNAKLRKFPLLKYKLLLGDKIKEHEGYYCWNMQLPEALVGQLVHISLIRVFGQGRLWINYEPIWSQSGHEPERIDFLYHVRSPLLKVEFALTCGESPMCGFRGTFKVRTELEGPQIEQRSRALDFFAFSGLAFCFIYHVAFSFLRRRYNAGFMIATMSFCLCLRILLTGQGQLHYYLGISEEYYWRLEIFIVNLLIPSTISMSRAIFPLDAPARIERWSWGLACFSLALLVLAKSALFLPLMLITYIIIMMTIVSFILTVRSGLRSKRSATVLFAIAATTITSSTFLEVLNTRVNIELIPGMHPMGFLLSSIIASVLFSKRISEAFTHAEVQELDIKEKTEKLTEDIALFDRRIEERTMSLRLLIESLPTGIILISKDASGLWKVNGSYSRFLTATLGISVSDWNSFLVFLSRLGSRLPYKSASELEAACVQILSSKAADFHALTGDQYTWTFEDAGRPAVELRLAWIPIRSQEDILGAYLFLFDVTSLTRIQRESLRLETELGALTELMSLNAADAGMLGEVWKNEDIAKLRELAQKKHLGLLTAILGKDEIASLELQSYRTTLDLLFQSYFKNREAQYDLKAFLLHPIWRDQLSPADYQRCLELLDRSASLQAS